MTYRWVLLGYSELVNCLGLDGMGPDVAGADFGLVLVNREMTHKTKASRTAEF